MSVEPGEEAGRVLEARGVGAALDVAVAHGEATPRLQQVAAYAVGVVAILADGHGAGEAAGAGGIGAHDDVVEGVAAPSVGARGALFNG